MNARYTLGQLITLGFAACLALTLLMGGVALFATSTTQQEVQGLQANFWEDRLDAEELQSAVAQETTQRGSWLLTGDPAIQKRLADAVTNVDQVLERIKHDAPDARETIMLQAVAKDLATVRGAYAGLDPAKDPAGLKARFATEIVTAQDAVAKDVSAFTTLQNDYLLTAREATTATIHAITGAIFFLVALAALLALALAYGLTRLLRRQVGSATQNLAGSAAELQAASNQQATASAEQAAAINEVSSTMKELLTSSYQITESARRVARIAEDTLGAVRVGEQGVVRTQEAMETTRHQVDAVVTHMVELGRKSQQIGGVLELIRELAEQTNILAINATIEAAGAGESGKRFAAVADEVRKLAERVTGSAREIRALIEDVRTSANTTLMVTEAGSKAVEAGHRQVAELATSFGAIAVQIDTTTAAAREIELGTKQQATAVEQVTFAITDVAQAAKESEASARQALETATNLAGVARDLSSLIAKAPAKF